MIPPVVASERGTAQTGRRPPGRARGSRTAVLHPKREGKRLESRAIEDDGSVPEALEGIAAS